MAVPHSRRWRASSEGGGEEKEVDARLRRVKRGMRRVESILGDGESEC